ncbi:MAG: pyridoxamine 5'-phosphate oxidase family protein [Oscillospiraceae bacterium]|nr:pyridoxamine 5'-phosphate oxidase family protein [Oscillospiraceae bacterium]
MLPDQVKRVFEEHLWYIATCGVAPNVVPVGFKRICGDGRLAIGAILLETTLENIKLNNQVAVACAEPLTGEAYQIKGTAELSYEGKAFAYYQKLTEVTFKGDMQLKCAVIITPDRLINASPNARNKEEIPI